MINDVANAFLMSTIFEEGVRGGGYGWSCGLRELQLARHGCPKQFCGQPGGTEVNSRYRSSSFELYSLSEGIPYCFPTGIFIDRRPLLLHNSLSSDLVHSQRCQRSTM